MTNAYKKLNPSAADLFRSAHHQNNTSFGAEYATRQAKMKQKKQKMRCLGRFPAGVLLGQSEEGTQSSTAQELAALAVGKMPAIEAEKVGSGNPADPSTNRHAPQQRVKVVALVGAIPPGELDRVRAV
jgi:hypothetical protein